MGTCLYICIHKYTYIHTYTYIYIISHKIQQKNNSEYAGV